MGRRAGAVIEQRTHEADLTGHLLAQGGWTHVSLPAIAEQRTVIKFPRSGREAVRDEVDVLCPAREGRARNAKRAGIEAVADDPGAECLPLSFSSACSQKSCTGPRIHVAQSTP